MSNIFRWIWRILGFLIVGSFIFYIPYNIVESIQNADGVFNGILEFFAGIVIIWLTGYVFGVWERIKNWDKEK